MDKSSFNNLVDEKKRIQLKIDDYHKKLTELDLLTQQFHSLKSDLETITLKIGTDDINHLSELYNSLIRDYKDVVKKLKFSKLFSKLDSLHLDLSSLQKDKDHLLFLFQGFLSLKQKILEAECLYLDRSISILNHELSLILPLLFDTPITVLLKNPKNPQIR